MNTSIPQMTDSTKRKFRTRFGAIEIVTIERESDAYVWINGRRNAKRSSYESYFDSFEEAKNLLVSRLTNQIERLKADLHQARTALGNVQSLKASSVQGGTEKQ